MSYCAPQPPNFGFLDHGCAVYGGLLNNLEQLCKDPKADNKNVYFPQFNLSNFWQRPCLVPHGRGFPEFLFRYCGSGGKQKLPPGHWPYDVSHRFTKNQNILTGVAEDESTVKLWGTNHQGDRKTLWEIRVQLDAGNNTSDENWKVVADGMDGAPVSRLIKLPSSVLELRDGSEIDKDYFFFARCEKGLFIVKPSVDAVIPLIKTYIETFSLIPYMKNEVVVLDSSSFLWHGDLDYGTQFSRVKTTKKFTFISPSDHPRLVYAATSENVTMIDLREKCSTEKKLYSVPDYDDAFEAAPRRRYVNFFEKPTIEHLKSFVEVPRIFIVVTSRKIYLLDERMPGKPYLEIPHSVCGGGDYIAAAPSFRDPQNASGRIFPFYILQHTAIPDVQHFSLYDHSGAVQWSMLAPIKRILEPVAASRFFLEQPSYGIRVKKEEEKFLYGIGPTRAIHIQNNLCKDKFGNERHLLFRLLDDGSLWLEGTRIVDDSFLNESALLRAARQLQERLSQPLRDPQNPWHADSEEDCLKKSRSSCKNIIGSCLHSSVDEGTNFDSLYSPLDCPNENTYPEPPVVESLEDPEKLFSQLVLEFFNAS